MEKGRIDLKLNLGCGREPKKKGWINVDHRPLKNVDQVADLNKKWPWLDDSVDTIRCHHLLEHIPDIVNFMDEAWRVLKKGGKMVITVPHHKHRNADTDPTHIRRFTEHSMEYWFLDTAFESFSNKKWKECKPVVRGGLKIPFLNRYDVFKYTYLIPPYELEWEMEVIKYES